MAVKQNLNLVTDPRFAWRTRRFSGYDIPPQEVAELYKLYTQTGGPSWIDHTNWFANKTCATWYGLIVAGGRVTTILLPQDNGLSGRINIPSFLANFGYSSFYFGLGRQSLLTSDPMTYDEIPSNVAAFNVISSKFTLSGTTANIPSNVRYFSIAIMSTASLTGPSSELSATLQELFLHSNANATATFTLGTIPSEMRRMNIHSSGCSIEAGATPMSCTGLYNLYINSLGLSASVVDAILERIYLDRAIFTNAAPILQIHGTNAAPSGVYQDAAVPSTGLEYVYKLVNDPDGEGFKKWTITATSGTYTPAYQT
jgi:hypothetical protein